MHFRKLLSVKIKGKNLIADFFMTEYWIGLKIF